MVLLIALSSCLLGLLKGKSLEIVRWSLVSLILLLIYRAFVTAMRCGYGTKYLKPLIYPLLQLFLAPLNFLKRLQISLLTLKKPGLIWAYRVIYYLSNFKRLFFLNHFSMLFLLNCVSLSKVRSVTDWSTSPFFINLNV